MEIKEDERPSMVSHDEGLHDPEVEHRARFMSDTERLLVEHPHETLNSSSERGLTSMQAEKLLAEHGPNVLEEEPRAPLYIVFLLQFYNLIIMILLLAAIMSFVLGNCALEALAQMSSPQYLVIRDGEQCVLESKLLVPGDIVVLSTGDVVPADVRLFERVNLKVNEMLLTGESEDVSKKYNAPLHIKGVKKLTADNMVLSSTAVTAGNARGIVVETGMSTRVGSIAALLKAKRPEIEDEDKPAKRSWNPLHDCLENISRSSRHSSTP
ncbi:hypothetical protein Poli38472_001206 [Pythium oligandrum]|uniref:Cation-transporting P-type ATPase N-terminal domain-containing protein n=1 Tax=Pythium oligandrum TaxID=41045 RepID=A0A8K1CUS1_PYTOL|nr:hypothetical protein Poli38472_001206 [Pythium oligandrum]|eukprot:TMW69050.1 hypothetical protein Poli38472_001206 [Pythium oligandrum]